LTENLEDDWSDDTDTVIYRWITCLPSVVDNNTLLVYCIL